jgi:hypothetical protein
LASAVFAFYNHRGECENRIEEFKNGFRADRLSCHRFLANSFRLFLERRMEGHVGKLWIRACLALLGSDNSFK